MYSQKTKNYTRVVYSIINSIQTGDTHPLGDKGDATNQSFNHLIVIKSREGTVSRHHVYHRASASYFLVSRYRKQWHAICVLRGFRQAISKHATRRRTNIQNSSTSVPLSRASESRKTFSLRVQVHANEIEMPHSYRRREPSRTPFCGKVHLFLRSTSICEVCTHTVNKALERRSKLPKPSDDNRYKFSYHAVGGREIFPRLGVSFLVFCFFHMIFTRHDRATSPRERRCVR